MNDRDAIYVAAIKLPPSSERDIIIDGIVRAERTARLPKSDRHYAVIEHYRHILGCIEFDRSMPIDGFNYRSDNRYLRNDWVDVEREVHAQTLAQLRESQP